MSAPRICLSLYGTTAEICAAIEAHDADLYEIRLDLCLTDPDGPALRAATRKPLLFTAHSRPDLLEKYWPFADYLDVEQGEATGRNMIVSIHTTNQNPEDLWNNLSGEHITKIVIDTEDYAVLANLLKLNRKHEPRAICFAAGEIGAFTRIASGFNGAPWIYTSLPARQTGNGQFTYNELIDVYKLRRFDRAAPVLVFGIIGNPVSHSLSPGLQNRFFAEASLPWIYLPFLCKDLKSLFANAHAWNAKGFSITHPFKQEIIPYLGDATPEVEELQSCNTVARVNDQWIGTNTDAAGIRSLLEDVPLNGARAVILGAGASARTFASIIRPHVSSLSILARNPGEAEKLAEKFQAGSGSLQDLKKFDHDVLIQATPVGWQHDEMPVGAADLKPNTFVIDSIYRDTPLLRRARDLGCKTLNGEKWFYAQARAQFDWWKSLNL